jgi:hypothetical protein
MVGVVGSWAPMSFLMVFLVQKRKEREGGGQREWEIVNVIFDGGSPEYVTS